MVASKPGQKSEQSSAAWTDHSELERRLATRARCGGEMKVIAFITEHDVVDAILRHLERRAERR